MKGKRAAVLFRVASISAAGLGIVLGAGCGAPPPEAPLPAGALTDTSKYDKISKEPPKADAGVTVTAPTGVDETKLHALVTSRSFSSRPDPFALLAVEKGFDASQNAERFLQMQTYSTDWTPPVEPEPEVIEAQPYRRLAGVMVGDSVSAIIDMGDGQPLQIIYPGERIPGTEWTVVSIDPEKAVLRRSGNKKPKEVIVSLAASSGIIVVPSGGNAAGGNTGGPPGGGRPGGAPGGPTTGGAAGGGRAGGAG